jgi:hypothetical protein
VKFVYSCVPLIVVEVPQAGRSPLVKFIEGKTEKFQFSIGARFSGIAEAWAVATLMTAEFQP